jgi:hypothetical protein
MNWLMSLPALAQQALVIVAGLVGLAAGAWLAWYAQGDVDRYSEVDTNIGDADGADMPPAQPRHVRAGPPAIQGPDGMAVLAPLPPHRCSAIARLARAMAASDFRKFGRPSGNPYSRYTRAHAIYSIEYEAHWEDLSSGSSLIAPIATALGTPDETSVNRDWTTADYAAARAGHAQERSS